MNKTVILAITVLTTGILSSCSRTGGEQESAEVLGPNAIELNAEQFRTAGIVVGQAGERAIRTVLKVNGTVNVSPQNIASVSAPLGGFIKNTSLVQGSTVTQGEVLALVENLEFIELQQSYLETKARYAYAEVEFKRHSELYKENVYSEKNVQQTETEYKTLKSQLKGLEQKLLILGIDPGSLTEDNISGVTAVKSPISGYVRMVNVNIGKYVNPTDVMFEIVNPGNIILELTIFEKDVRFVAGGQKVTFTSPDHPGNTFSATIYQAGRALDNDKTAKAYARIENPDGKLLSGMYVNAGIETSNRQAVAVPTDAVVQFDSSFYIFVYKGKRMENGKEISDFEAVKVQKGGTDEGFTEIMLPATLPPGGLEIVIKGAYAVLSAWKNAGEMAC